jgi:hypothetical protein
MKSVPQSSSFALSHLSPQRLRGMLQRRVAWGASILILIFEVGISAADDRKTSSVLPGVVGEFQYSTKGGGAKTFGSILVVQESDAIQIGLPIANGALFLVAKTMRGVGKLQALTGQQPPLDSNRRYFDVGRQQSASLQNNQSDSVVGHGCFGRSIVDVDYTDSNRPVMPEISHQPNMFDAKCRPVRGEKFIISESKLTFASYEQSNGSNKQGDSCEKEAFGEKGKLLSIFDDIGVRLLLIPVSLRNSLAFLSFFGAFLVCLLGWHHLYDERRLRGSALLFGAFWLGNCGFWLLFPRLLGEPL